MTAGTGGKRERGPESVFAETKGATKKETRRDASSPSLGVQPASSGESREICSPASLRSKFCRLLVWVPVLKQEPISISICPDASLLSVPLARLPQPPAREALSLQPHELHSTCRPHETAPPDMLPHSPPAVSIHGLSAIARCVRSHLHGPVTKRNTTHTPRGIASPRWESGFIT